MKKIILISIAVASLSTTALAGHRTHHRHLVMGVGVSPVLLNGSGGDHAIHSRNLRDSGYNPKDDFDSFGNVSVAY